MWNGKEAPRSITHIFASSTSQSPGGPARCLWGLAPFEGETDSLHAGGGATGSYANDGFLLANSELPALGRGWASRTGTNELAPPAEEAGPVSFKPHVKGSVGQCGVWWPRPSPKASMSLQRIVRVSLEHPTSAVCVAGVETLVDIYG